MRPFIFIITVLLFTSCGKDRYFCPEEDVLIIECELNFGATYLPEPYDIDTAYIKGDSVFYKILSPPEYDCDYLSFCFNYVSVFDSFPPQASFNHHILSRIDSQERVIKMFSYDITFLDEYFEGDSIGITFFGKDILVWTDYYKR